MINISFIGEIMIIIRAMVPIFALIGSSYVMGADFSQVENSYWILYGQSALDKFEKHINDPEHVAKDLVRRLKILSKRLPQRGLKNKMEYHLFVWGKAAFKIYQAHFPEEQMVQQISALNIKCRP